MSYIKQSDPQILKDVVARKEFIQYKVPTPKPVKIGCKGYEVTKFAISRLEDEDIHIDLNSYQAFISQIMGPNTPIHRMLANWDTGMGKTIMGLDLAMRFIEIFEKQSQLEDPNNIGSVWIIGFTDSIFKKELLSYPQYGFVTREDLMQLRQFEELSRTENKIDVDNYQEFLTRLRKRLTSRRNNGYFKFIGYKAFVNRIFMLEDSSKNINDMSEEEIRKALKEGSLKWNKPLLDSFRNSLVICDEIHNTYNSLEKNNWGIAIQMVLDHHPTIKALFMSATPLNNSPTEIADLLNLLLEPSKRVTKAELFNDKTLKPGSDKKIAELARGRVSFIQDLNPALFASQEFIGQTIKGIGYLKFTRCVMSPYHYNTYKEEYQGTLAQDEQYLNDFALPNPDTSNKLGIFRTNDIKRLLSQVTDTYFKKYGFKYENDVIIGHGLYEENIANWSSKMAQTLKEAKDLLRPNEGKVFIYHNIVHISGVLFIEQLFLANGIIGPDQNDTQSTLCAICGNPKSEHAETEIKGGALNAPEGIEVSQLKKDDVDFLKEIETKELALDPTRRRHFSKSTLVATFEKIRVGFLEYEFDGSEVHILALVITKDFQTKGIGSFMLNYLRDMYPLTDNITLKVYKESERSEQNLGFYTSRGFQIADEDTEYWYLDIGTFEITGGGKRKAKPEDKSDPNDHVYYPARYVIVHSEMDKSVMTKNIERFNSPNNIFGTRYKYIIGSKIIKESHNIKATRHTIIIGRPDNIPTLIQILGRTRRKRGHMLLPPEFRTIAIKILTSCLPVKDPKLGDWAMSHEEIKYREKTDDYKIIQLIEKILHENAIDGYIFENIIQTGLTSDTNSLGPLKFKPVQPAPHEIIDKTFNIFYFQDEIKTIMHIIKRLFIEVSYALKYEQLWSMVQNAPFQTEVNTRIFDEDNFIIALDILLYQEDEYIRPLALQTGDDPKLNVRDLMWSNADRRIMMPDGVIGYIHYVGEFYIFIPFINGTHMSHVEAPYRTFEIKKNNPINIFRYLKDTASNVNYDVRRLKFRDKYENVPLEKLTTVIGKFGTNFHQQFLEEVIYYVFNLMTNPLVTQKSEFHDFYYKMLYYYNFLGLVIWAVDAREFIKELYKPYILPSKIVRHESNQLINVSASMSQSVNSKMKEAIQDIKHDYKKSMDMSQGSLDLRVSRPQMYKKDKIVKVDPKYLPIGHFLSHIPRFYHPEKEWFDSPEYTQVETKYQENDIVIGYHEKSLGGLRIKFKLRRPIQYIEKYKDTRKIHKGSMCRSNSKEYLLDLARKLKIKIGDKVNVSNLCGEIETQLILNEVKARQSGSNIKWFFAFWEQIPGAKFETSSSSSSS